MNAAALEPDATAGGRDPRPEPDEPPVEVADRPDEATVLHLLDVANDWHTEP